MSPGKRVLYKDTQKQYDSFTWTTDVDGEYRFCFSNEFSTFTHKLVYFDFQVVIYDWLGPEVCMHRKCENVACVLAHLLLLHG